MNNNPDAGAPPIRILVVDDHIAFRAGLAALLSDDGNFQVVGEAGDVAGALARARELRPDVVLMDLRIPGGGGVEATLAILRERPSTRVLVVTTYDGEEDIHRAIQAGASGYLLKGITADELFDAIRRARAGARILPDNLAGRYIGRTRRKDLSPREVEVVGLLVAGRSNKEISRDLRIGEASVKTHLKSVFHKLGVADRTQAAIEAIRTGLVHFDT